MKIIAYYEAFDHYGRWYGTATMAAIKKAGLLADLASIAFGPESLGKNGWGCEARPVA